MTTPLGAAFASAGTSAAVSQSVSGTAYRTFTAPLVQVRRATLDALMAMGVRIEDITGEGQERITGSTSERQVEVVLEPISARATRMGVVAKGASLLFNDASTAAEIVAQTEKVLLADVTNASAGASRTP